MKRQFVVPTARIALLGLAIALGGCSSLGSLFGGDKVDYRKQAAKSTPLDVPPDLTQLARSNRYQTQDGVVSAAASTDGGPVVARAPGQSVAIANIGAARVERQGNQRWLVVPGTPEQVWPKVRAYWLDNGFTLVNDNAEAGVMETDWQENRSKLPQDFIRRTLGRVIDGLYDTGERDRYRIRLERGEAGTTEVYVSHRGLQEVYTDQRKEATAWQPRPSDPALEAEVLAQLLVKLGATTETARTTVASATAVSARARAVTGQPSAALEVDEPFERAWRRVGVALDRSGFTVEDRDRSVGIYIVRYVSKPETKEEPGFFAKLFGRGNPTPAPTPVEGQRFRVALSTGGEKTLVSVLTVTGAPENGEVAKRIVAQLVDDLR